MKRSLILLILQDRSEKFVDMDVVYGVLSFREYKMTVYYENILQRVE